MLSKKDLLKKLNLFTKFKSIAKAIQMVAISSLKQLDEKIATRQLSILTLKELFTISNLKLIKF